MMNPKLFLVLLALLACASPMFGAEMSGADEVNKWVAITSGFAMAIASGLCGLAQAKAVASSAEAMARNPGASAAIRFVLAPQVAEQIGHGGGPQQFRRAEGQPAHGAKLLLKLAGDAGVEGEVSGVVRTRRQLVDQQLAGSGQEELHAEHAHYA